MGLSISERLLEEGHGIQATTPVTISKKVKRVFSDSSDVATPSLKLSEECPAVKEEQTILYGRLVYCQQVLVTTFPDKYSIRVPPFYKHIT